jgi:hypothetical protein
MISGLTLFAVTDAITVAARAGTPIHETQISVARTCAKMVFGTRKLWSFLARCHAAVQPKWLIFGQPWIGRLKRLRRQRKRGRLTAAPSPT